MMFYLRGLNRVIEKIIVFTGSKKDFNSFLTKRIPENSKVITFMEVIEYYNAHIRGNDSCVQDEEVFYEKLEAEYCIVRADDYGSVLPHVIMNFANIISLNYNITFLYVQNPPRRVIESLKTKNENSIEFFKSEYPRINRDMLVKVYKTLNEDLLGQEICKKKLISSMYRLTTEKKNKPVVLLLYGPSGVGKTESAKSISKALGGSLLRIQFSMMQTSEAIDYIFGSEHSKSSLARDMMGRESNVILIDEFDKVSPSLYNAFYELFDEGKYVDSNYSVDLGESIFLLTSNFLNENEIRQALGPAMFSRIGCCIEYSDLTSGQKKMLVDKWYDLILSSLKNDEQCYINYTNIHDWFIENVDRYNNIRSLKIKMENAVFEKLTEHFILNNNI